MVSLAGEIDMATSGQMLEALRRSLGPDGVTVDLSAVTFMDSSGIHGLLTVASSLEPGALLVLRNPSPQLLRLFEIVGLDRHPNITVAGMGSDEPGAVPSTDAAVDGSP